MGISISKFLYGLWYYNEKEVVVTMVGLDATGKTTILDKLLTGKIFTTIPTTGYNIQAIKYKNLKLEVWDIGGAYYGRNTGYTHLCPISNAIILVIDYNDRIDKVRDQFHHLCNNVLNENIPILIYANKQDLPNALSCNEIPEKLNLHSIKQEWYIQGTCATTGDGLYEGLEWLYQKLNQKEIE